jgi:hypothetical protein
MSPVIIFLIIALLALLFLFFFFFGSPPKQRKRKQSKGEIQACKILESIYHEPFRKVRPDFLKNPKTGRNLELDCYNENLKIALEYQGRQHYHWPNYTGQSLEEFLKQVERDRYKEEMCRKNGVKLIKVPYTVREKDMRKYIEEKINE